MVSLSIERAMSFVRKCVSFAEERLFPPSLACTMALLRYHGSKFFLLWKLFFVKLQLLPQPLRVCHCCRGQNMVYRTHHTGM